MGWLSAFVVTQLVEAPIYALALWRGPLGRKHAVRAIVLGLAASALTHPLAWFVLAPLRASWTSLLAAEAVVVLIEGVFLWALGLRAAVAWALSVNAVSFGVGLCLGAALSPP